MVNPEISRSDQYWFGGGALLFILSAVFSIVFEEPALIGLPFIALMGYLALVDFKKLFILLFAFIPLSMEYELGAIGTDLPTEPLMIALAGVFVFYAISHADAIEYRFLKHPIILLVLLNWLWIGYTSIFSIDAVVSLKFFMAKTWYLIVFIFMAAFFIKNRKDFMIFFWAITIPLTLITLITLIRHYTYGFAFDNVNDTLTPYFRNHVTYAALLSLVLPFLWFARKWMPVGSLRRWAVNIALIIVLTGLFYAYTRGAWLAVVVGIGAGVLLHWRLLRPAMLIGLIVIAVGVSYFIHENRYMLFAPEFETTVYHEKLEDHIAATVGFQDVSSAERIYRWVAAFRMFNDHPVLGFGPGNFYPYYKNYTVTAFETYVSENEEKSTVHNYWLMTLITQGLPGFLIFLVLVIVLFFQAQRIYFQTLNSKERDWVMALILCLVIILVQTSLSELLEVDKVGTFFYLSIALLVNQDLRNKRLRLEAAAENSNVIGE